MPRVQDEQVFIAGEDQTGLTVQRDFEKFVITGVAAGVDSIDDGHKFAQSPEKPQKLLAILEADIAIKFRARQNVGQFIHCIFGNKQNALVHRFAYSFPGN